MPDGSNPAQTRTRVVDQVFGHNRAPADQVLAADFEDLAARIEAAVDEAQKAAPKAIKSEADLLTVGRHVNELRGLAKLADAKRSDEKAPVLELGRQIDGFFRDLSGRLDETIKPLQRAADDYARRQAAAAAARAERERDEARRKAEAARQKAESAKSADAAARAAAEAESQEAIAHGVGEAKAAPIRGGGVSVGSRKSWDFEIVDYGALDLNALRHFIARADVEKAIRALVRVQKGDTAISGVRVFQAASAQFRK